MYDLKQNPFIILILSLFLFVGCTSEEVSEDLNEISNEEFTFAKRDGLPDLNSYLEQKYPDGYTFGYERTFTEDEDTFVVKEVFADGSTEVTGFVNLTNGDFTQYLELNRTRDLLVIDDFVDDELYEFDASDEDSEEIFVEGFLEDFEVPPINLSIGRFWGWSCSVERRPSLDPADCYRTCCYKVFWGSVTCSDYTCGEEPGSDPVLP